MKKALKQRLKNVKLLVLDVDGVLTNGEIVLDHEGREIKIFDVQDGFGLVVFQRIGYEVAIISSRSAKAVTARLTDLKIQRIYQDARPKIKAYQHLLDQTNFKSSEVCFMGDDLPDLEILQQVGLAVVVPNAVSEVKKVAHFITKRPGGKGAVREVIELILKTQGQWDKVLKNFKARV